MIEYLKAGEKVNRGLPLDYFNLGFYDGTFPLITLNLDSLFDLESALGLIA